MIKNNAMQAIKKFCFSRHSNKKIQKMIKIKLRKFLKLVQKLNLKSKILKTGQGL